MGTDDGLAPYDNVSAWSTHTTSNFALRVFPGDHFYFTKHLLDVVKDVETRFSDRCEVD
jgi:surfactin synthase thioesterase subunit